jgi:UDP-N-acetylglucosamine--N-acetylmuramyl-(pentapeptide) pyrophosphoryl-undecaprenol N-acetylglucosamine transferase
LSKVLIAVSGTGGHVYPGIAVAEELRARRPDDDILFATAAGKPGADWIRSAGFRVRPVAIRGLARTPSLSWLLFPFALVVGGFGALFLVWGERPDLVVGTGGYVSGPVVAFAAMLGIPTLILEQNTIPGIATKLGSLFARQVHVADPGSIAALPRRSRVVVSGNPVRRSVEHGDGTRFWAGHGLAGDDPLVLVLGGSQGARAVTEAALGAAKALHDRADLRMVIQTGRLGWDSARDRARDLDRVAVVPFLDDIGDAYAAASLVVARAGAMTLAELAAAGKPAILVPYPYAAEDHQTVNAERHAAGGAARVLPETELTPERLADWIRELSEDPATLRGMAEAARAARAGRARERIADACEAWLN